MELQHIFLSPHYDDAALSCGGLLAELSAAGQRTVVATIFGGKPDYARLSPFAQMIHDRPLAGADPIEQRRVEERQALAILGAESRLGDFPDCIYRQDAAETRWLYAGEEALFGALDPAEEPLVEEVAACVAALAPRPAQCTLYAPLAIGRHVDHQLTRRSAAIMQRHGYDVRYYEDYPYVARDPDELVVALATNEPPGGWQASLTPLSLAALDLKTGAVLAYASQLGVLFPGAGDTAARVAAALHTQALACGRGKPAERLWRPAGPRPPQAVR